MINKTQTLRLLGAALLLAGLGVNSAFGATDSDTTTLQVNVAAEASITMSSATTTLTSVGTEFANYTGSSAFTYKIRTTQAGGSGTITVNVADFTGPGTNPDVDGGNLAYTCTVAAPATQCSGSVVAANTNTSVATFGADAHSALAGNAGSVAWTLLNDPAYTTGLHTALATVTITAL